MKGKDSDDNDKICSLRKALQEEAESDELQTPRNLVHQSGHPKAGEPESIQQKKGTGLEIGFLFCAVLFLFSSPSAV